MISARQTLTHLGIPTDSRAAAIQVVRLMIEDAAKPLEKASKLILDITGLNETFDDNKTALHVTQHIVDTYIQNDSYDEGQALLEAFQKAADLRKNNSFMFVKGEKPTQRGDTMSAAVEGIETKVAVNSSGKIKKGGRQILAAELYKKYVTDATPPATNKEFVQILIKQLGMTPGGSSTYAYNLRKANK